MAADGYIRIDTKINQAGAQTGLAQLTKSLKGFALAAGLAFGVAALVNFTKSCIKLGSDLQEVQNVVDVTFGSAAGKINSFAKTAASGFGLSELAAKQYTGTMGAMLKSMGFTTDAAADMSIEMAKLAGDMASFYNLDTDEAFAKIRSGISGETEPLKQLGVNLSEANLQAYAMAQGISQSYSKMSEQNKALIRYNYLLDVTADAQGDFARTSGSWANQVRVLQMQWESLKGTLGGAFIAVLTPVLAFINRILGALTAAAQAFASFISLITGTKQTVVAAGGGASGAMDDVTDSTNAAGDAASKAGGKAKKGLAAFDELNVLPDSSGGGGGGGGGGIDIATKDTTSATEEAADAMQKKMDEFFKRYAEQIGQIKQSWIELKGTALGFWDAFKRQFEGTDIGGAAFKMLLTWLYAVIEAVDLVIGVVGDLILAFNIPATIEAALQFLATAFQAVGDAINAVKPGIMAFIDKGLAPVVEWIGGVVRDALDFLGQQFQKIGAWFTEHRDTFTALGQALGTIAAGLWTVLEPLASGIWAAVKFVVGGLVDLLLLLVDWALQGALWIANAIINIGATGDAIFGALGTFIAGVWDGIASKATEVWGGISGFCSTTWANIKQNATTTWDGIKGVFTEKLDAIKLAFTTAWDGIKTAWGAVAGWFTTNVTDPIQKTFDGFKTAVVGAWNAIGSGIGGVINNILTGVETFINGVIGGINWLINGLNALISLGGKAAEALGLGGIAPVGTLGTVSLPRIKLAKGAVIPPNREFAAILGDQKRGVNIETPLATMLDAFRTALAEQAPTGGSTQPIYITVETTLDGKTVARNQVKYLPKEYERVGPSAVKVGA